MQEYQLKLIDKKEIASGTKSFIFEKPQGFEYKAGEFMYWTLPELKHPDERGPMRHFTISSSPTEDYLSLTCRMREGSGYKKTLDELSLGSLIQGRGPTGVYVMEDDVTNPQVFLAGGIGITPFRSRIKYIFDKKLSTQIHLIYANNTPEQTSFKEELDSISQQNQNIKVTYVMSKPEESKVLWDGPTGYIDSKLIQDLTTHYQLPTPPTFWVCGPPPMVDAMEEILQSLNIGKDQIKTEKFTGY